MINCNDILNKSAELQAKFKACATLSASDMDLLVDLIIAVNSCGTGQNGVGVLSTVNNGDGTFTITYTDNSTFTSSDLTGPQGTPGTPGIQGIQGLPGLDGNTILNGIAIPNTFVGKDGDFYLKTDTYDLYGPKTGGNWTVVKSLIGPVGQNGIDGVGVITGGTSGQLLSKIDNSDYNTQWIDPPNGTGDMSKLVYDTNNNGIVDNSELVNGLTVETAVPPNALFSDTTYTDAEIKTKLEANSNTNTVTDSQLIDINTINSKLDDITAGTNISIDKTNPNNPIISSSGGGAVSSVNNLTGAVVLNTDNISEQTNKYFTEVRVANTPEVLTNTNKVGITAQQASDILSNNNKINNIVAGTNISLDISDPKNPIINATGGSGGSSPSQVYFQYTALIDDESTIQLKNGVNNIGFRDDGLWELIINGNIRRATNGLGGVPSGIATVNFVTGLITITNSSDYLLQNDIVGIKYTPL